MEQKTKRKGIKKAICVVLLILLMIGIAFLVANIVHNNDLPASSDIKNGL